MERGRRGRQGGADTYPVAPPGARDGGGGAAAAARAVPAPGALGGAHQQLHARRPQRLQLPHLRVRTHVDTLTYITVRRFSMTRKVAILK